MKPRIRFFGGGGFAIEALDYLAQDGFAVEGYLSPREEALSAFIPWLGNDEEGLDSEAEFVLATGSIRIRRKLIVFIEERNIRLFTFFSSKSYVSRLSKIGKGAFISPFVSIIGDPVIGEYFFANSHSLVGHGGQIGSNVVLGPGSRVNGNCVIGDNVILGSNATLLPSTRIGDNSEIGIMTYPRRRVYPGQLVLSPPGEVLK